MEFGEVVVIASGIGFVGGAVAHAIWLREHGRSALAQRKLPSNSKKAKGVRVALFLLSLTIGTASGFVVGTIGYDYQLKLGLVVLLAFLSGLSTETLIARAIRLLG